MTFKNLLLKVLHFAVRHKKECGSIAKKCFTVAPCILILSKSLIYQLMHIRIALKNIKIYIKTAPTCFGLIIVIRERII